MKRTFDIIRWWPAGLALCAVAVLLVWCGRADGTYVEVGFDNRIELTSQEIRRIEQIGEWEFLSVRSEVVVDTLDEGFFSDDRLVVIYTGTPRLGIDMGKAGADWVLVAGDTVRLQLPPVHLLDGRFIDEARTKVFYESGTWPNRARKEMYAKAHREILSKCVTPENLRQAEENARRQFTAMFRALGFRTVEIDFVKK